MEKSIQTAQTNINVRHNQQSKAKEKKILNERGKNKKALEEGRIRKREKKNKEKYSKFNIISFSKSCLVNIIDVFEDLLPFRIRGKS